MSSFTPLRNRDAWSTIRGYVYQVDLTIQRWLDLEPNQILELECGEDIDIVGRALVADSEERDRLLEQVKHRDSSITLRSPEAVTAIACFIEHRQNNLTVNLVFQFTTNTKVARERISQLPKGMKAIEAWENLREGKLEQESRDTVLAGIRNILDSPTKAKKPKDLQDDTWQKFCNFIQTANNEEFLDLIQKFQWVTKAPDAHSLNSILQKKLFERQHATTSIQAQEQYQRLFWYVFRCLCKIGRKQLTLEELHEQLTLPTLSSSDQATLEILNNKLQYIEVYLINLEQEQQKTNLVVAELDARVKQLVKTQDINGAFSYVVSTPILDIHPLAEHFSPRGETVEALARVFMNYTWIVTYGSLGSGKTQLVVLLVHYLINQGLCNYCAWLRFRDLTTEQACLNLDQAVERIVESPLRGSLNEWYNQLCNHLGTTAILVLDDLPKLERGNALEQRLIQLGKVCHSKGVRLISTSFYQLPQNLHSVLGSQILHSIQTPAFTNCEAAEIFQAYGAPDSFLNSDSVTYINGLANQHPSLLVAVAEYLHQQDWEFTPQTFEVLLRGDYSVGINEETLNRLLNTLQDNPSQELLYRLNLIQGYFFRDDVIALAAVNPNVERPQQRLNSLLGVWIQRDVSNRLMVSPLVKLLRSDDLSIKTRRECHLALGERIVQQSEFNQYKAFNAIHYFYYAESFNRAGALLLLALNELEDRKTGIDDGGLLGLWSTQHLPERMDLGIRLTIRSLQISIRSNYGKDINYLISDLDRLLALATAQESGIIVALVTRLISKCVEQVGVIRINRYFLIAIHFLAEARLPNGNELFFPEEVPFESLIWAISRAIQSAEELLDWIHTLEQFSPEQRERVFSYWALEDGCLMVAEKLWLRESEKPETEQDWQSVLLATRTLAYCASNIGLELLWACAVSSEIIILAEYSNNLDLAIEIAESTIASASNDPRVQFILKECLGRQLSYANRYDEAISCFTQALEQQTESYPILRMYALLRLSRTSAIQEPYLSLQYAQQAVNLAQSSPKIPEYELVIALGELAIAKWLILGDLYTAFEPWNQAAEQLLNCKPNISESSIINSNFDDSIEPFFGNFSNILQTFLSGNPLVSSDYVLPTALFSDSSDASILSNNSHEFSLQQCKSVNAWRSLFVVFAHINGYFTILASTGNPPSSIKSGEPYAAPFRGVFLTRNSARADYYNPSHDCLLLTQLAQLAEAIGNDELTLVWAMRGINMARDTQLFLPITSLGRNIIPQLILKERYSKTLDLAVEIGTLLAVLPRLAESGRNILEPGIDVETVFGAKENQLWRQAESCALIVGVLPIIFYLTNIAILNPGKARNQAMEIAEMCREISATWGTQTFWTTVTEIFEQIYLQQSTCADLITQYQTLTSPDKILPIIGLVAATLQQNATLTEVFRVHISIFKDVHRLTRSQPSLYRRIILPYLFNYWKRAVERIPFRFKDAQETAQLLHVSRELPINQQGQAILVVINDGLEKY